MLSAYSPEGSGSRCQIIGQLRIHENLLIIPKQVLPFLGIVSSKFPTKEAVDVALAAITEFNSVKGRSDNLEEIIFFSRLTQAYDLAIVHEQYLNQNSTKGIS